MVDSQWFVVHEVRLAVPEVSRFASLNKGETEAISLAITIGADALLMDEAPGRIAARSLGISVLGTAGLLVIAKNQGYIAAVRPFLDDLVNAYRFRLSKAIYKSVLQAAGELRDND